MPDLIIRGAHIDIAVEDGLISAIGPGLPGAPREIDARALAVLPGIIDVHVHEDVEAALSVGERLLCLT